MQLLSLSDFFSKGPWHQARVCHVTRSDSALGGAEMTSHLRPEVVIGASDWVIGDCNVALPQRRPQQRSMHVLIVHALTAAETDVAVIT